jgi:hypothetical protein
VISIGNAEILTTMLPTTILVDKQPRCVVRPVDTKALHRFIRSGRAYILADKPSGTITHRNANDAESAKWHAAFELHKAWGGDEETFFGIPL